MSASKQNFLTITRSSGMLRVCLSVRLPLEIGTAASVIRRQGQGSLNGGCSVGPYLTAITNESIVVVLGLTILSYHTEYFCLLKKLET
jgi:hypothetical protein